MLRCERGPARASSACVQGVCRNTFVGLCFVFTDLEMHCASSMHANRQTGIETKAPEIPSNRSNDPNGSSPNNAPNRNPSKAQRASGPLGPFAFSALAAWPLGRLALVGCRSQAFHPPTIKQKETALPLNPQQSTTPPQPTHP